LINVCHHAFTDDIIDKKAEVSIEEKNKKIIIIFKTRFFYIRFKFSENAYKATIGWTNIYKK